MLRNNLIVMFLLILSSLVAYFWPQSIVVRGFGLGPTIRTSRRRVWLKENAHVIEKPITRRSAPNKRTQLQWLVNNVEKRKEADSTEISDDVFHALQQLADAKTAKHVAEVGRKLEAMDLARQCSPAVQERIIKAASMTGLLHQALNLTQVLFLEQNQLPSEIAQTALCTSLRKASRHTDLEALVVNMGNVAVSHNQSMSLSAFNILLASLSDQACPKQSHHRSRYVSQPNMKKSTSLSPSVYLQEAWDLIRDDRAHARLGIKPDEVSFATVLQAAAKAGNRSLSDEIWRFMTENNLPKNTNACNARLKMLVLSPGSRQRHSDNTLALGIWEDMQRNDLLADRYTIDLMLMVWIRQEQQQRLGDGAAWKTIESVLDRFCEETAPSLVSQAFGSFLLRLCQSGAVFMARAVFLKYVAPPFSPVIHGCARKRLFWVDQPTTQHFNVLLEGYRKLVRNERSRESSTEVKTFRPKVTTNETGSIEEVDVKEEAWRFFETMHRYGNKGIGPDAVTVTTMMGFCSSTPDLCKLLGMPLINDDGTNDEGKSNMARMSNSAFLRASITRFGELGDVSSSLWLFAKHGTTQLSKLRLWNVLIGAIAKACQNSNHLDALVDMQNPQVSLLGSDAEGKVDHPLLMELNNLSFPFAAEKLLTFMNERAPIGNGVTAPPPDSQSYCLVASSLQHIDLEAERATNMFREAQRQGIPADGRFVNAQLRCYGENVEEALAVWKAEIRPACVRHENRNRERPLPSNRARGKNLLAAYHGLMYCCGRSLRPDLAVRLAYAMKKEGLEPSDVCLHSYNAGKNERPKSLSARNRPKSFFDKMTNAVSGPSWALVAPYESVLYVECTKYDQFDKRRIQDKRVRIIV